MWFGVVCFGFIGAGILIGKSYHEWQENPIATSITTHAINDLDFPNVTICPPMDSNTALYHDLVKAGSGNISLGNKKILREAATEIFLIGTHFEYSRNMLGTSYMGNIRQVFQGYHSLPIPYNNANGFEIKMWNLNGTITTPWFGEEYPILGQDKPGKLEYYKEDREFHMVLEFPEDIKKQIGSGSLNLELEVDIREAEGWVEEVLMKNYTFHKTAMDWFQAQDHCQENGGSLVSVISEGVNEAVNNLAGFKKVWVGGKKEFGEWSWSDNSTWGFSLWNSYQPRVGGRGCVISQHGWKDYECELKYPFICQTARIFKGRKQISLTYAQDQIYVSSCHVWYKYKAASQQLLDKWENKRMTGVRFSWRIENPTLIMSASTKEVGRSIQTPGHTSEADQIYEASLVTGYLSQFLVGNGRLVIELDVSMKQSDDIYVSTSYMKSREEKTWSEAKAYCESKGGQLASISSQWEQTMAVEAARGNYVWLGGRRNGSWWQWLDNSTMGFNNWKSDYPKESDYLVMDEDGQWYNYGSDSDKNYFLCKGKTVKFARNNSTRIEFKKQHLSFFPFRVHMKCLAMNRLMSNSTSDKDRMVSTFTLNWFIETSNGTQLTDRLPAKPEDWKQDVPTPTYELKFLSKLVHLSAQLRLQNMTLQEILNKVILRKLQISKTLYKDDKCSLDQIKPKWQEGMISTLISTFETNQTAGSPSDEDIKDGLRLFRALVYCPPKMVFQLYKFIDHLLINESSRTIIQTIVNLFLSGAVTDDYSFILVKKFYDKMASTLDLQYGDVLLATSSNARLENMLRNDWPFFVENTIMVKNCIFESKCNGFQSNFANLGKVFPVYFLS